jgi:hypothetical protein
MADDEVVHVLKAHRFELLDEANRVRAVLGQKPYGGYGNHVGLEIFDAAGSARAWLMHEDGAGVHLALAIGGNQVLVASAGDPGGELSAGPSITLCDLDGAPVLSWYVDEDGRPVTYAGDSTTKPTDGADDGADDAR